MNDATFGEDTPVYVISVAAELSGLHPQTLRQYDRLGLVRPGRTPGRGRRYSMRDIQMLREVQRLSQERASTSPGSNASSNCNARWRSCASTSSTCTTS